MTSHLNDQSLYVMQNEFGLIKIGRSINPEQRRYSLEMVEKCQIALILVRPGDGHREEEFHIRLADHRVANEWFDGGEEARLAIADALAPDGQLIWPYQFDLERAEDWIDGFWDRQITGAFPKALNKLVGHVRNATKADWVIDSFAWEAYLMMETGIRPFIKTIRDGSGSTEIDGVEHRMPEFSRDLEAAMTLWPPGATPATWEGSALDCCKAALQARRAWWKATQPSKERSRQAP
jgi:hypothetical protein